MAATTATDEDIATIEKAYAGMETAKTHEDLLQADQGCDFDFLVGCRGAEVPRHSH